jgi:hypothetical protein
MPGTTEGFVWLAEFRVLLESLVLQESGNGGRWGIGKDDQDESNCLWRGEELGYRYQVEDGASRATFLEG